MPSRQPPPAPSPTDLTPPPPHHRRLSPLLLPLCGAAAVVVLILMLAALFVFLRKRKRKLLDSGGSPAAAAAAPELRRFTYGQLRRATAAFSPSNKLGQGGFGPVFKGALASGEHVAVKVMDAAGLLQGEREFHNELALASHLFLAAAAADADSSPGYKDSVLLPFGFSLSPPRRHMMLVYELMPNGSLQDALLGRRCPELVAAWSRRIQVATDVARALHYLHDVVDPPVIHGDVKPSNVLLDANLRARLADFGLARIRSSEEAIADASAEAEKGEDEQISAVGGEDDMLSVAESTTTTVAAAAANGELVKSPEDDDGLTTASPVEASTTSIDSGRESRRKGAGGNGSDWWWRQDNANGSTSSGGGVKDYVMEWIRSEIKKERPKSDWIAPSAANAVAAERKKPRRRAREWWREEYAEELAQKHKRRVLTASRSEAGLQWWEKDDDGEEDDKRRRMMRWMKMKSWSRRSTSGFPSMDWWADGGARSSRDWASASGEFIPKSGGAVSSTPSMRGTVCYVAPEYGGGGPLSEKCDIYSFGVLLLVLISGRRPLQVTASAMTEFKKASLISWARHLAHNGRLPELIDPALKEVDRDQALLCITVALLCIQRSPSSRPSSEEVLGILTGDAQLPHLPLEFSPSPPGGGGSSHKASRKKAR